MCEHIVRELRYHILRRFYIQQLRFEDRFSSVSHDCYACPATRLIRRTAKLFIALETVDPILTIPHYLPRNISGLADLNSGCVLDCGVEKTHAKECSDQQDENANEPDDELFEHLLEITNFLYRSNDLLDTRKRCRFEVLRIRHRSLRRGDALYRSIEVIECIFEHLITDLGTDGSK